MPASIPAARTAARIHQEKCDRSPWCPVMRICPRKAVVRGQDKSGNFFLAVEENECTGCGICVSACPRQAIVMGSI